MESIKDDPRFAHVASDPKFKPMPSFQKRIKIDSRFNSVFTNKHFSHKTHMDKRGRPFFDSSKRKSAMERFYDIESDDSSDSKSSKESSTSSGSCSDSSDSESDEHSHKNDKQFKDVNATKPNKKNKKVQESKVGLKPSARTFNAKEEKAKKTATKEKVPDDNDDGSDDDIVGSLNESDNEVKYDSDNEEELPKHSLEYDSDNEVELPEYSVEYDSDNEEELPEYSAEYDIEETGVVHKWNELHTDAPKVSESTHRLAVCNMDWDFVKAQDLFVLFKSFVPEEGCLKSVTIYPSEYGKQRMAEEITMGPKEIREQSSNNHSKRKKKDKYKDEKTKKKDTTEKTREYQLNRLRYYYAVVDCDSVNTADKIYSECDGKEFQLSSVQMDLRFIPDDMCFDDDPRERFTLDQTTVDYEPNRFTSTALCQAKVEVTWDETEFDRLSRRMMAMQQKDLQGIVEENKYADIIAPPESDSEEEPDWLKNALGEDNSDNDDDDSVGKDRAISEEDKIKMYRKVLMDKLQDDEEEKKNEDKIDKEFEFMPGLKSSVQKKMQLKEKQESGMVENYLKKKRQKKIQKKMLKIQEQIPEEGEKAFSDDELPSDVEVDDSLKEMMKGELGDTFSNQKSKKKRRRNCKMLKKVRRC